MFKNRIKSQIRQIQTYAEQVKKRRQYGNVAGAADEQEETAPVESLKRDQFNIVKIILVYTKARRLFAINSQSKDRFNVIYGISFCNNHFSKDFTNLKSLYSIFH